MKSRKPNTSNVVEGFVLTRTFEGGGCVPLSERLTWRISDTPTVHSPERVEEILESVRLGLWLDRFPTNLQWVKMEPVTGQITPLGVPVNLPSPYEDDGVTLKFA
jgi:hypothetical protein